MAGNPRQANLFAAMTVEVEHAMGGSSASGRINVADYRADIHGAVIKTERLTRSRMVTGSGGRLSRPSRREG
jgi:hypothetical protein